MGIQTAEDAMRIKELENTLYRLHRNVGSGVYVIPDMPRVNDVPRRNLYRYLKK